MLRNAILLALLFLTLTSAAPYGPHNHHCSYRRDHTTFTTTLAYPISDILAITRVFQKGDWEGIPVTSSLGKPNRDNAIRYLNFNGHLLEEKLSYLRITNHDLQRESFLFNGPINMGDDIIHSYDVKLVISSVCQGTASSVVWTVNFCASNGIAVANMFSSLHEVAFRGIVESLGGREFTSC